MEISVADVEFSELSKLPEVVEACLDSFSCRAAQFCFAQHNINDNTMIQAAMGRIRLSPHFLALLTLFVLLLCASHVDASVGDRLPEFKECVKVRVSAAL